MNPGDLIDTVLAGLCGGAALMGAVIFARSQLALTLRLVMSLTCATAALYILKIQLLDVIARQSVLLAIVLVGLSVSVPAWLWIAAKALFEDRPVPRLAWAAPAILAALGFAANLPLGPYWRSDYGEWSVLAISAALVTHGFYVVCRGWRNDLVEGRRRLRGPLLAIFGLSLLVFLSSLAILPLSTLGLRSDWIGHADWIVLTGAAGLFATLFDVRKSPFAPAADRAPTADTAEEDAQLRRLGALMSEREIWRDEALSIGGLAREMGLAEHRLRWLINTRLGRRNFAAFINGYRIEAAKARLAQGRETIAAIAYDVGFASLNPFNRAFKDITGLTPTAWAKQENLVEIPKAAPPEGIGET